MASPDRPFLERLPLLPDRQEVAIALALLLSAAAWWLRAALAPVFPPGYPFITFFPAVIVTSFLFGRAAGIVAGIACGLLAWYFFVSPGGSLVLNAGTSVGMAFYGGVVGIDIALIHWMQQANGRLRVERERSRALAERTELLFHELQHRVSNNLQMAGAVLSLQKRGVADAAARQALDDAGLKLQLIGRIQRQLYGTRGEQVSVDIFLQQLIADLAEAGGKPGVTYVVGAAPGITLAPETIIPVALIVAEAVANAIEHGFSARDHGHVEIAVHVDAARLTLEVADDGVGVPPGFAVEQATSLGLKIACTLARQLRAEFGVENRVGKAGAVARLSLPLAG